MTSSPPRLRFAPSPTGFFHVGGARTALFNWLIARQTGGTFVLRIEDTDTERNKEEWTVGIQNAMRWIGVDWDEGPYFQSQRTHLYKAAADKLVAEGRAYFCDCVGDVVRTRNVENFGKTGEGRGYDGFCRDRGLTEAPGRALRFRTPDEGTTVVVDLIRGEPAFENSLIEDFVVQRGNGGAMFLLANVVDDIDMRISHVVRAEEHLPNTPKAVMLWEALSPDVPLPVFAHLPVIVNEQRKKLSKRRDKVAVEDYELLGILPEAMCNYLGLLGWAPGQDREIISVQTMIDEFKLQDVNPAPAFFDIVKLAAFNAEYIRALSIEDFVTRFEAWFADLAPMRTPWSEFGTGDLPAERLGEGRQQPPVMPFPHEAYSREVFVQLVPLIRERVKHFSEVLPLVEFAFVSTPTIDPDAWAKTMTAAGSLEMIDGFLAGAAQTEFTADGLKALVEQLGTANGLKLGKAQAPIRVAVTGKTVGPPLFEALEVLGREVVMARITAARGRLN